MKDSIANMGKGWLACVATLAIPVAAWVAVQYAWHILGNTPWNSWTLDHATVGVAALAVAIVAIVLTVDTARTIALVVSARTVLVPPQALVWRKIAVVATAFVLSGLGVNPALASQLEPVNPGWVAVEQPVEAPAIEPPQPQPSIGEPPIAALPALESEPVMTLASTHAQDVSAEHQYTVVTGDSLWRIAARQLGPGATDAQIAQAWPHLYAANKTVIGANPSLIHPGQVLTIPEGLTS